MKKNTSVMISLCVIITVWALMKYTGLVARETLEKNIAQLSCGILVYCLGSITKKGAHTPMIGGVEIFLTPLRIMVRKINKCDYNGLHGILGAGPTVLMDIGTSIAGKLGKAFGMGANVGGAGGLLLIALLVRTLIKLIAFVPILLMWLVEGFIVIVQLFLALIPFLGEATDVGIQGVEGEVSSEVGVLIENADIAASGLWSTIYEYAGIDKLLTHWIWGWAIYNGIGYVIRIYVACFLYLCSCWFADLFGSGKGVGALDPKNLVFGICQAILLYEFYTSNSLFGGGTSIFGRVVGKGWDKMEVSHLYDTNANGTIYNVGARIVTILILFFIHMVNEEYYDSKKEVTGEVAQKRVKKFTKKDANQIAQKEVKKIAQKVHDFRTEAETYRNTLGLSKSEYARDEKNIAKFRDNAKSKILTAKIRGKHLKNAVSGLARR